MIYIFNVLTYQQNMLICWYHEQKIGYSLTWLIICRDVYDQRVWFFDAWREWYSQKHRITTIVRALTSSDWYNRHYVGILEDAMDSRIVFMDRRITRIHQYRAIHIRGHFTVYSMKCVLCYLLHFWSFFDIESAQIDETPYILNNEYRGCWWLGDLKSHCSSGKLHFEQSTQRLKILN